ncbi:MAG: DNA polymerase III subunit alpha, partial [Bacillota bacterium]
LKMDFLGLRTLTVINNALDLIAEHQEVELELTDIPLTDQITYELLQTGNTEGIFQIESELFQRLITKLQPTCFEDIIALLALGRPGPLGSGMVDDYIDRRHGEAEVEYLHPDLESILEETYGVIIYQEQVMRIANQIADYSLGQADILRRGMGKKKPEILEEHRQKFINGALDNGYSQELATELFDLMEYFGGYGFNKSHSAAYALVSYQTAYLKTYYPVEYMAALLSSVMGNSDKVARYIEECERMGIEVLPPDVNESRVRFTVVEDRIRFGLAAVKHVGSKAIEEIIASRRREGEFESVVDFCQKVSLGRVNQRVIESLIKAGAFASLPGHRAQLLAIIDELYQRCRRIQKEKSNGQSSFGDLMEEDQFSQVDLTLPDCAEYSIEELLALEKEYLGLYLSGHPLDQYDYLLDSQELVPISEVKELADQEQVKFGGVINQVNQIRTKHNQEMAFVEVEDRSDSLEVVIFPDLYDEVQSLLLNNQFVVVEGKLDQNEDGAKIIGSQLTESLDSKLFLKLSTVDESVLEELEELLADSPGITPVYLVLQVKEQKVLISTADSFMVELSREFKSRLEQLAGVEDYSIV